MFSRTLPVSVLITIAASLFAGTAACSTGDDPTASEQPTLTEPQITATPQISAGAVLELPLRAFALSPEQLRTTSRAEGLLMQQCMRRLGFTTWQPPEPAPASAGSGTVLKIGVLDEQQAAQYGYHDPAGRGRVLSSETPSAQSQAEIAALSGDTGNAAVAGKEVPQGGCSGEATRKLRDGAPASDPELYGRLWDQSNRATESDSRVTASLNAWSTCMKEGGFTYGTPWAAAEQVWANAPTPAEVALAGADVACKKKTGLAGVWVAALTGYQNQLIERNRSGLDAVRGAIEYELRKADSVLRGTG